MLSACTQELDVTGCLQLRELPGALSSCSALRELIIEGCSQMRTVPDLSPLAPTLQVLNMQACLSLHPVPGWIDILLQHPAAGGEGLSFAEALEAVRAARPEAEPNAAFGAELLALERRGELGPGKCPPAATQDAHTKPETGDSEPAERAP